jgi:virulence-associated protein VagC
MLYTIVYGILVLGGVPMSRTAKVFMTNRSQAVRLPKEFQFSTDEVFIRKEGEEVILSPARRIGGLISIAVLSRPTRSWRTSTIRPCRSASAESDVGPRHARHGHVLLHHEALELDRR